jgi:hypothetical protein
MGSQGSQGLFGLLFYNFHYGKMNFQTNFST